MKISKLIFVWTATFLMLLFIAPAAYPQQADLQELDARLRTVEDYLEKLPPSLATYTGNLQESINNYTKNLETGLEEYSERLERSLESKLLGISHMTVEIDSDSRAYKKIDTPTGTFFIAVRDRDKISGGYRLSLAIGNPYNADFRDFTLRLVWGQKWSPSSKMTYEQWRNSLAGAQYSFKGKLLGGKWNPVEVDMVPAEAEDIKYIEAELGVSSIELEVR